MKMKSDPFKLASMCAARLVSRAAYIGVLILLCVTASAENLFVSGSEPPKNCLHGCGAVYKFTWDGVQSIFAFGLANPWDVAFDPAGNLFVVDYDRNGLAGGAIVYKITPNGLRTTFASGLNYPAYLATDRAGNVYVADHNQGIIYKYKPTGSRTTFASGLYHPVGMACDSSGNLFVADNSLGNIYQGSIYEYKPTGSRTVVALLDPSDRPSDLAFDNVGNLFMADLSGKIYRYGQPVALRPITRTVFGSVPTSAQSLACDGAGNLLVVDVVSMSNTRPSTPNAIYKFTPQGVRSMFASAQEASETFACLAFQPVPCCQ